MKFECDSCHAQYMIADDKVGKRGVKVKCKKCQHVIIVRPERGDTSEKSADKSTTSDKAAKPEKKSGKRVEQPAPTHAQLPPPGAEVSAPAAAAPASEPIRPPMKSKGGAIALEAPKTETPAPTPAVESAAPPPPPPPDEDEAPETTGPGLEQANLRPAPVSMFGETQLSQAPVEGPQASSELTDEPTQLGAPPQMSVEPPSPPLEPTPEPTMVTPNEAPREEPPAPTALAASDPAPAAGTISSPGATASDDALGDQLSGAFSAMFNVVPAGGAIGASADDEEDHRASTRVLDKGSINALRKQAERSEMGDSIGAEHGTRDDDQASGPGDRGADDGPADQVWHAAIDDQDVGPLSLAEVGRHIEAGRVDRDSLVWKVGMDDWLPAGDVPAVRALFDKVPMPRIARLEDEPQRTAGFDMGPRIDDGPSIPPSPFDDPEDSSSWRPHGLTDVYQAANLAETAGMGALNVAVGASKAPLAPPVAASNDEWRPGAASALASLVQEEIKRLDSGPPPATDDDLSPADDASINAPLFGGLVPGGAGPELETGPELGAPMQRVGVTAQAGPPMYGSPQASGFMPTPPPSKPGISPLLIGGIAGGALLLVVVVVVLVAVIALKGGEAGEPKILIVDGKTYLQQPDGTLLAADKPKADPTLASPAASPTPDSEPSAPPPAAPAEAAVAAADAPPTGAEAEQVAEAPAPPPPEDNVAKAKAPPRAPPKERKVVERAERPPPRPSKASDCDPILDFDCKAGSKPAATSREPVKDALSKTDVLLVVRNNMKSVENCGSRNKVGGIIKMSWKILPSGNVTNVQVTDSKFAGTPVGNCVSGAIKRWKFPASRASTPVNFPMKLGG